MNKLVLYNGKDSYEKFIEYGNIIKNEGYIISQIWQLEEDCNDVGINFKKSEDGAEILFLERDGEVVSIETAYSLEAKTLIELYNKIKM